MEMGDLFQKGLFITGHKRCYSLAARRWPATVCLRWWRTPSGTAANAPSKRLQVALKLPWEVQW